LSIDGKKGVAAPLSSLNTSQVDRGRPQFRELWFGKTLADFEINDIAAVIRQNSAKAINLVP
jgi:hypothetical protein